MQLKKMAPVAGAAAPKVRTLASSASTVELAMSVSQPKQHLHDYTYLFFGERGIGKTTLAAQFADPAFFFFEPGGRSLAVKANPCESWSDFLKYKKQMRPLMPGYCKTSVLDTFYMAYERCYEYKLKELGLLDPRDEAWGNGWKMIAAEFRNGIYDMMGMGCGFVCTAHHEVADKKNKKGEVIGTVSKLELQGQSLKLAKAIFDLEGYYYRDDDNRAMMRIRPAPGIEAKCRIRGHFMYADGSLIEVIPMGNDEEEAFHNFNLAFNNALSKEGGGGAAQKTISKLKRIPRS